MSPALVVFTRDLRLRDLPALDAAVRRGGGVVPVFVIDDAVLTTSHGNPNRVSYLLDALSDLRSSLRDRGGDLVVRRGDWVDEIVRLVDAHGASSVHVSEDVSGFATARLHRLRAALDGRAVGGRAVGGRAVEVEAHPGVTVVPPGTNRPSSGDYWKVFTPYQKRWLAETWRPVLPAPDDLDVPAEVEPGALPTLGDLVDGEPAPGLVAGGERAALERLRIWAAGSLAAYADRHDDLAGDATSHISADLHFGCLSPLEVATRLRDRDGGAAFVRQLCWRDFYHQFLAARSATSHEDVRDRGDRWRDDPDDVAAWTEGRTGFPLVDAAMRQLSAEGFMHNRARMVVASFLTKDLYVDWRTGARHFMEHLVDGDVANNQLNWQWTAGTGTDTNPNRIFNPTVQSTRFDPYGEYIRRYVPELAGVPAPEIHEPSVETRARTGYPAAIVDHREAIAEYRAALDAGRDRAGRR
ncbi:MAG: DNA photolyase family protein [Actinomycetota bacterium]|nr:DNA photolyase family protein [Actinomycetota bacterium]